MPKGIYVKYSISFVLLATMICVLLIWNINSGSVHLSAEEVGGILLRRIRENTSYHIVWNIRLPRIPPAAILGGALPVPDFLLQTLFANPIAGPFALGISSGVKLVVSLAMIVLLGRGISTGSTGMILATFASSMISMGFALMTSGRVKKMSMLVICDVMISHIYSAIADSVATFADDVSVVNPRNWSMGSFSDTSQENVRIMTAVIFLTLLLVFPMAKSIGAYQMGEVYARNMGVNILRLRVALTSLSNILSAYITVFTEPTPFMGIAVLCLVKSLFKTAKPILIIPGCFLGGTVSRLFCDSAARTVLTPIELSISSMTVAFDVPIVIYMMMHNCESTQ